MKESERATFDIHESAKDDLKEQATAVSQILTNLELEEYIVKCENEQIDKNALLIMTYDQFRDEMHIPFKQRKKLIEYVHENRDKPENHIEYTDADSIKDVLQLLKLSDCDSVSEVLKNKNISTIDKLKELEYTDLRPHSHKNQLPLGPTVKIIHYIQQSDPCKSDEIDIFPSLYDIMGESISKTTRSANDDAQKQFFKHLRNCCHFNEEFDVYQVLAFESTLVERDIITLWQYRLKCLKGFLCSITQIFGMIVVLYQLISKGTNNKNICNKFNSNQWEMNVLAFFLSTYLSYTTIKELSAKKGLYEYIPLKDYDVRWLDHGWLYFGFVVNTIASVCAVWGSFFIVFYSDAAIDMVLNSVALFFLTELDDLLVNDEDYEEFEKSMNQYFIGRDKNKGVLKRICGVCGDASAFIIFVIIGFPFEIIRYITIVACVTVPFYIAYCF